MKTFTKREWEVYSDIIGDLDYFEDYLEEETGNYYTDTGDFAWGDDGKVYRKINVEGKPTHIPSKWGDSPSEFEEGISFVVVKDEIGAELTKKELNKIYWKIAEENGEVRKLTINQ